MLALVQLRDRNTHRHVPVQAAAERGISCARALSIILQVDQGSARWIRRLQLSSGTTQACIQGIDTPMLEELYVSCCHKLISLRPLLSTCSMLRKLWIDGSGVTQDGIDGIEAPLLTHLCVANCRGVTDLRRLLGGCRCLTHLWMSHSGVTQEGIVGLQAPELELLNMMSCHGITDISELLRDNTKLKTFIASDTSLTQHGIRGVECPRLATLNVKVARASWMCEASCVAVTASRCWTWAAVASTKPASRGYG